MTREEAIEILQGAIKKPNTKDGYLGQAIDMAIKALEQEPKPMVEIDLYSVIKQKYIEREVLDKIRAEIDGLKKDSLISWASSEMIISTILNIIDKYRVDKE